MVFDTLQYWMFFLLVLALVASTAPAVSRPLLVFSSLVFYGFWDVRFVLLLVASITLNFLFGILVEDSKDRRHKGLLAAGIASNLLILGFFKYFNFFVTSFAALFGIAGSSLALNILLPVGISFFTFEGIAYLVDIHRGQVRARRNVIDFALFISFFPHLIAGPIIRPRDFFPQIGSPWQLSEEEFRWSILQIIKGLVKKCIFADFFAYYADAYFSGKGETAAAIGVLAFTFQIYFDFAGYTDIARGCARLLGFYFPPNFERPYLAANISEFWRRWHISLSTWLRDYLYIPLGGNRKGLISTYRNYLIVMGLGGLWHGANWNFLFWGLYHGVLLAGHRAWVGLAPGIRQKLALSTVGHSLCVAATFLVVTIGWIPFRASSWSSNVNTFKSLLSTSGYSLSGVGAGFALALIIPIIYCTIDRGRRMEHWLISQAPSLVVIGGGGAVIWLIEVFAQHDISIPFIYFQF